MQTKNLRNRIFVPTMLSILILLGVFAITAFLSQERDIKREVETKLISVEDLFTTLLDINASMMGAALNAIMRDRQLTAAFREKDRESLYNQSRPLFEQLRSGYGITHFYFTDSSRVNLLRVHQQDRYGDRINRFTTLKAEKTGKLSYGIELGPLGTFTLRVVIPWHDEERLIGYVELGMEIEQIIDELHKVLGVELYILIEKEFLDRQDWEASMKMLGRDPGWNRLPFQVLTAGTLKIIPEEFIRFLSKKQHLHKMSDKKISFDGQIYLTKYLDLKDAAGRSVGDIVILNNVTKKVADFRKLIFLIGVSCLGISGAMFIFFYVFLGRVEKQLLETQRRVLDLERDRSKFILDNLPEHISIIDQNGCFAPLPTYVGDKGYARIFAELVWPLAERFHPDLLLVSAGYDAHWSDPLAQMNLSLAGYAWLQREIVALARALCRGRVVFALEGGYELDVLAYGVLNGFYAMRGEDTLVDLRGPSPHPERPIDDLIAHLKEAHGLD